eukprot:COSAG01_NODE_36966_length_510_cov_0.795620_1_plen_57_part_01
MHPASHHPACAAVVLRSWDDHADPNAPVFELRAAEKAADAVSRAWQLLCAALSASLS